MKLTLRSEYALLALIYLARAETGSFAPVERIAAAQGIPLRFLEQISLLLKRGRILKSLKGKGGGYALARPASKINLADVIRLIDGALAPTESVSKYFYETTPIERERKLLKIFKDIRDYVADKLETTSLADVI